MLKVLIADDEKKVGLLIKNLIEWERLGLSFMGLVQDGESAYDMILHKHPDIVITDIRMPKLTGLEMIEKVSAAGLPVHFIVVSGYQYFEYAQRALKYGVKEYLLKPIDETELNEILEKVCAEEIRKRNLENKMETLEKNLLQSKHMLHKELMERAFAEATEQTMVRQTEEESSGNGFFQAAALKVDRNIDRERNTEQEELIMQKLSAKTEESLRDVTTDLVISVRSGMWLMLLLNFKEENSANIEKALNAMFYKMRDYIGGFEGCEITMGCSSATTEFSRINLILEMSREAAERRIFGRCGSCIGEYADFQNPESASISAADIVFDCRDELKGSISIFQAEEMGSIIKKCFERAEKTRLMASEYYRLGQGLIEMYADMIKELFQVEIQEEAERWAEATGHCKSVNSLRKYIKNTLREHLILLEKRRRESERRPILQAIQYVQENYGKKILLEEIAEMSGFNATYFSEIFKKETGKNFTTFLLEVRIEASKALLRDTTKTIYEIAADVGYRDSKFFSQQFTKTVGIKPKEYRRLYY